jgi:hypothetical protein
MSKKFQYDGKSRPSNKNIEEPLAHSIKLYQSSTVNGLLSDHRETPCVAFDDWDHIQRLLLDAPLA